MIQRKNKKYNLHQNTKHNIPITINIQFHYSPKLHNSEQNSKSNSKHPKENALLRRPLKNPKTKQKILTPKKKRKTRVHIVERSYCFFVSNLGRKLFNRAQKGPAGRTRVHRWKKCEKVMFYGATVKAGPRPN